ncbi:hypothetical protein [Burkholderia sp. Ac-20365]|uniref:hypothetical protein n=1 Tax=Burkholderia sp. Ac-20365 TaxID=2703897 RepID=UPI00197C6A65|nr:hypothetical protein [Burkholderia sp. Ac-20365]MBN3761297.1 hypothetical protein [Burkholderia sp. Ac-20365]
MELGKLHQAGGIFGAFKAVRAARRNARQMEEVRRLALTRGSTGGLIKRIDENRELLAFLQQECPDVLAKNWWVEGWIRMNDEFFTQLQAALEIAPRRFGDYPRPWPGKAVSGLS